MEKFRHTNIENARKRQNPDDVNFLSRAGKNGAKTTNNIKALKKALLTEHEAQTRVDALYAELVHKHGEEIANMMFADLYNNEQTNNSNRLFDGFDT